MPVNPMPRPQGPRRPVQPIAPRPRAAYAQPFGHARAMINEAAEPPRYLGFGISFMVVYGLGSLAFIVIGALVPDIPELKKLAAIMLVVGMILLAFSVSSGVLCIMRKVAGVWMGVVLVGLGVLGGLLNLVSGKDPGGALFGLLINGGLLAAGINDLRRYFAFKNLAAQGYGAGPVYPPQAYGHPGQPVGYPPPGMPPQAGFAPPAVDYNQPYRQRSAPAQAPAAQPSSAASPRAAVLGILALAASLEAEQAQARLERARQAAQKLMGEKYAAEISRVLSVPASVVDPNARMAELGPVIAGNAKLVESLRKCLVFVLKEGAALSLPGEQFLANYDVAVDNSVAS